MRAEFTEQPVAHSSRPLPPRTEPCCQPLSLTAMANSSDPSGPAWPLHNPTGGTGQTLALLSSTQATPTSRLPFHH